MNTHDRGEVRWRNALVQHVVEVDILEERMSLDLFRVTFARAKTASRVARQQLDRILRLYIKAPSGGISPFARSRQRHEAL